MKSKIIYLCFVLILTFTGFVKGSCLEYGHSCWGAHGKRSGGKIYRSIDGSESQQTEGNKDVPLQQDKVKTSELLSILLDRNGRSKFDDATNPHESSMSNSDEEKVFDSSDHFRRKLRDSFRKGIIFHYSPKAEDHSGKRSSIESNILRHNHISSLGNYDYYPFESYPSYNQDVEYLDLK